MSRRTKPDIDSLLADRARYEAWLAQLAAKASQIPSHVVDRVRADYQDRLTHVVDDLRARADELRAEKASLEQRIASLGSDLAAKRDARAEDELRALVGEFEDSAWSKKAGEHDAAIHSLDAERTSREADLARIRDLLAEATRPSRAVRAITEAEIPEEPTPVRPSQPSAAASNSNSAPSAPSGSPPARGASTTPTGKRPSPFDELGFLRTVVGRATPLGVPMQSVEDAVPAVAPPPPASVAPPPAPVAAAPPPPPAAPQPPLPPPPTLPEPRPLPHSAGGSAVPRASAPAVAPPPAPVAPPAPSPIAPPPPPLPPPVPAAARRSIPSFEPPPIPDAPMAAPARASAPAMPAPADTVGDMVTFGEPENDERAARAEQAARTLKCQECGWMNNPTEWYCEKCGGELAAF